MLKNWITRFFSKEKKEPSPTEDTLTAEGIETNSLAILQLGSRFLVGTFVLAVGWAAFIPLDGGVVAQGQIAVEFHKKPVQHLTGGILERVLVEEGQHVKAGQAVARLSSVNANVQLDINKNLLYTNEALIARLTAELNEKGPVVFPEHLIELAKKDKEIQLLLENEKRLFEARLTSFKTEISSLEQTQQGLSEQLASIKQSLSARHLQLSLAQNELKANQELTEKGFISPIKLTEYQRSIAEILTKIAEDKTNLARTSSSFHETRIKRTQRLEEHIKELRTQLADAKKEFVSATKRTAASEDENARLILRAPSDGMVVGISTHAAGAVLSAGQNLMDIIPSSEQLIIEAQVPPHQISGIGTETHARIRFSALTKSTPVLNGQVMTVSADRVSDTKSATNAAPYYLVRVKITAEELKKLGANAQLKPGMPTEVMVTTEKRTFLSYLLKPVTSFFFKVANER